MPTFLSPWNDVSVKLQNPMAPNDAISEPDGTIGYIPECSFYTIIFFLFLETFIIVKIPPKDKSSLKNSINRN